MTQILLEIKFTMYFFLERLSEGGKKFSDLIKKIQIPIRRKSKKAKRKALSLVYETRQASGVILARKTEVSY